MQMPFLTFTSNRARAVNISIPTAKKSKANPEGKPVMGKAGLEEPDSSPDIADIAVKDAAAPPVGPVVDEGESGLGEDLGVEAEELSESDSGSEDEDDTGLTEEEEKMRLNEKKEKVKRMFVSSRITRDCSVAVSKEISIISVDVH